MIAVGRWNLERLAEVLAIVVPQSEATEILRSYDSTFRDTFYSLMSTAGFIFPPSSGVTQLAGKKIGLFKERTNDTTLIDELLSLLGKCRADYTNFFRDFSGVLSAPPAESPASAPLSSYFGEFALNWGIDELILHVLVECSDRGFRRVVGKI
jgi:uncharacterized protein YdiU (UPF0061 family)